eukprot:m.95973 g.95973  ORF g.95973 m.95973 type:complete len:892 (+) comp16630_c0_seq1:238-2913(+)
MSDHLDQDTASAPAAEPTRPVPKPRPRLQTASSAMELIRPQPPAPSPRPRALTATPPVRPRSKSESPTTRPQVVKKPDIADFAAVQRITEVAPTKDVLVRKAVTQSYGVNKDFQRPRTQVKRKGYADAKREREEAEAKLEEERRQNELRVQEERRQNELRVQEERRQSELKVDGATSQVGTAEVEDPYTESETGTAKGGATVDGAPHIDPSDEGNFANADAVVAAGTVDANGGVVDTSATEEMVSGTDAALAEAEHVEEETVEVERLRELQTEASHPAAGQADDSHCDTDKDGVLSTTHVGGEDNGGATSMLGVHEGIAVDASGTGLVHAPGSHNEEAPHVEDVETTVVPQNGDVAVDACGRDDAAIQRTLGLSDADMAVYRDLWDNEARLHSGGDFITAADAIRMFKPSQLGNKALRAIWNLCDTTAPRGQLSRDEFYTSCKLIALQQSGQAATLENLPCGAPLPSVGSRSGVKVDMVSAKRPWLTKVATQQQCAAAVLESGSGAFTVQKYNGSNFTLYANIDGTVKTAEILHGIRGGKKCYMLNGKAYEALNDIVEAVQSTPEVVQWDGDTQGNSTPLTTIAVYSDAVANMHTPSHGAASPPAAAPVGADPTTATSATPPPASDGPAATTPTSAPAPVELSAEEKHQRFIEEQERLAIARINEAHSKHMEAVHAWMSHKMMLEWQARGVQPIKYDKKVLKASLSECEGSGRVYAVAIACEDVKNSKAGKLFLDLTAGQKVEVMDAMNTPHGLWIIRVPTKKADKFKLGFVHTEDIMVTVQDVHRMHHGGGDTSVLRATPAGFTPPQAHATAEAPGQSTAQSSVALCAVATATATVAADSVPETDTVEHRRRVSVHFADSPVKKPRSELSEKEQMMNDLYASTDDEDVDA